MSYLSRLEALENAEVWDVLEAEKGPTKDKTVYTASKISKMDCPYAYKLQYVDGHKPKRKRLSTHTGSVLHNSAAFLHEEGKWSDWLDIFLEQWEKNIDNDENAGLEWEDSTTEKQIQGAFDDGAVVLQNYIERNKDAKVELVETPFFIVLEHPRTGTRYRFSGTPDQVRTGMFDKGWWIPDLKYWKQTPSDEYLSVAQAPTLYGLGLKEGVFVTKDGDLRRFNEFPEQLSWYMLKSLLPYKRGGTRKDGSKYVKGDLRGDPHIHIHKNIDDYAGSKDELFVTIQSIRMKLFDRRPGPTKCAMCQVSHICTQSKLGISDAFDLSDEEV